MLFLGAQKGYPPWAVSPHKYKDAPPISKPHHTHPAAISYFYAFFRLQSIEQWNKATTYINIAWSFLIHLASIIWGVDRAGVLLEMTLRPPLRFLALFRVFTVFHYIDGNMYLRMIAAKSC